MLRPKVPVVEVEILNPLVGKDRSEDKLVVLDVLARDSSGRRFNIEMQTRLPMSFPNRLLFYNCKNFLRQLREGEGYSELCPAISICLVDRRMFEHPSGKTRWHHSFRLRCDQNSELILTNDFEFHIFELPKFHPSGDTIGELSAEEKWLYLFTHAAVMEADQLSDLLGDDPYREAIGVLQMISKSPEDYQYYEDRLKFLRDEQGKLLAAKQEGEQLGLAKGLAKGRVEGRVEGREEGRVEGNLAGKIQTLQELLGDAVTTDDELLSRDHETLRTELTALQARLRHRDA